MFAKPFGLMLEQLQESYSPLALSVENAEANEQIYKQFLLLQWYVEKRFTVHVLLLAREWVVSALCILGGYEEYLKREHRELIEKQLNALGHHRNNSAQTQPIEAYVENPKSLADFWGRLTNYRNDVAHVQMNESPLELDAQTLEDFALTQLLPTLASLFPTLLNPTRHTP